jgi:Domain of unknown function (DUF6894)
MPRYFFHVRDNSNVNVVGDSEGAVFATLRDAKREAIGLGRDIVRHGLQVATWQIVVIDENDRCAFILPLVEIRLRKTRVLLDLTRRAMIYEPRIRRGLFAWLLVVTVWGIIVQAAMVTMHVKRPGEDYALASVNGRGTVIGVRFTPGTSVTDMSKFLSTYKASLISCSLPSDWYCLRISNSIMPRGEVESIVHKMKRESIVSSAAGGSIVNVE